MLAKSSRKQPTISDSTKKLVTGAVITAFGQMLPTTSISDATWPFRFGFAWFSESNRQEAMQHLQAATIAYHHDLPQQVELHVKRVQTITLLDLTDRVQAVVAKTFGYPGWRHFYPHPVSGPFVVMEHGGSARYEWHYVGIGEFARLIPPKALATLAFLEKVGLTPQAYWVADKRESATSRIIDPILSSQFGPWFVAISEWV
jgi:hypothetical protein